MKNRIIKVICRTILLLNFFLLLGFTGSCELGHIGLKEYVIKIVIVILCSVIPALKSGIFRK